MISLNTDLDNPGQMNFGNVKLKLLQRIEEIESRLQEIKGQMHIEQSHLKDRKQIYY